MFIIIFFDLELCEIACRVERWLCERVGEANEKTCCDRVADAKNEQQKMCKV